MIDILRRDGLSIEMLTKLSYPSQLSISLKKNLHYFNKESLIDEFVKLNEWYDSSPYLRELSIDYRIKSIQSAILKYNRYYPDRQTRKVFNDMLGFRSLCDNYLEIVSIARIEKFRVVNMENGKADDDGYRGVHVYFQVDNTHYPIEIQYNTYYDRQLNNWLHKYVYKKNYSNKIGKAIKQHYDNGKIKNEKEFKEVLAHVLLNCKEI